MLVEFKSQWFAPTALTQRDKLTVVSGKRFRKGVQEVPDNYFEHLPSTAVVVDGPVKEEAAPLPQEFTLRDYDEVRSASDAQAEIQNEVQEEQAEQAKKPRGRPRKAK